MTFRCLLSNLLLPVIVLVVSTTAGAAGEFQYEGAKNAVSNALVLQKEGKWEEAVKLLGAGLEKCGDGDESARCRRLIRFTSAYIGQLYYRETGNDHIVFPGMSCFGCHSMNGPGKSSTLLHINQSASFYNQILEEVPDHVPTLSNLAQLYIELGNRDKAIEVLKKVQKVDPEKDGTYSLMLGDLYSEDERWADALWAYLRSDKNAPDNEITARKIVEVYMHLPVEHIRELFTHLAYWESKFPDVSRVGYWTIMERTCTKEDCLSRKGVFEKALLKWVELIAWKRWASQIDIDAMPVEWKTSAVRDLKAYIKTPTEKPSRESWWLEGSNRKHILARLALAIGNERLLRGKPEVAAKVWEVGAKVSPGYSRYAYGNMRDARTVPLLALDTELTSLYFRFPALDREDEKFNRIVNRLFGGKGGAYRLADLEAIQRFHTTLGIIYAERGVWDTRHYVTNATFQLENAIKTARRRYEETGFYQPLPELKALLARGYEKQGDEPNTISNALDAAQAYLDIDRLDKAEEMLELSERYGVVNPNEKIEHKQLREILRARREIPEGGDPAVLATIDYRPETPRSFLSRQKFKALSDRAIEEHEQGNSSVAYDYASKAFANEVTYLVGVADLVRLEKVIAIIATDLPQMELSVRTEYLKASGGGRGWGFTLLGELNLKYIAVSEEVISAIDR